MFCSRLEFRLECYAPSQALCIKFIVVELDDLYRQCKLAEVTRKGCV